MVNNNITRNANKLIRKFSNYFMYQNMELSYKSKGIILNYHRVADVNPDPWALAVSPKNFSEQLEVLKKHLVPVRLTDLNSPRKLNRHPIPWVVVTFDDGYVDNLINAGKILQGFDIPATFFLTSSYIGTNKRFWWDRFTELMLKPGTLPDFHEKHLSWNLSEIEWKIATVYTDEDFSIYRDWNYFIPPPTARHQLFLKLYNFLRVQSEELREESLLDLQTNSDDSLLPCVYDLPLSIVDAKTLSSEELFEIGAHSISHADFRSLSPEQEQVQLVQSKKELEKLLGIPIKSFAYPHGGYQQSTLSSVRKAGFSIACTIKNQIVTNKMNRYILPRIPVINMAGNEFEEFILKFMAIS